MEVDYGKEGHLEKNESLVECAIRETEEETKRKCKLISNTPILKDSYVSSKNEDVDMYYFLAKDIGKSNNTSTDTHTLVWVDYDQVKSKLTYDNLKNVWNKIKDKVIKL